MPDHLSSTSQPTDRYSFLWLVLGSVALWFSAPAWVVPVAPWLGGVLVLRFFRTQPLWRAALVQWLALSAVSIFAQWGFIPVGAVEAIIIQVVGGLLGLLPFLLDRWAAPRLPLALRTLVYPAAAVAFEYGLSFAVTGTISSVAYTQFSIGPLMQIAAVGGIWPIVFLIHWTASVANEAWERGRIWAGWRSAQVAWAGVLALVLVGGALRLATAPVAERQVRVAGIALDTLRIGEAAYQAETGQVIDIPDDIDYTRAEFLPVTAAFGRLFQDPLNPTYAPVLAEMARLNQELLDLTRQQARAGAQIVAWSEANAYLLKAEEGAFIAQAQELAREEGIYLMMGIVTITPGQDKVENKVVTVDPQGQIAAVYFKNKLPIGENSVQGDGTIPVIDTPYGRLAAVICYDMDSPDFIRQLGQQQVDLLVAGSGNWKAISPWHSYVAVVRGIENGFSVVRPVRGGLLVHADAYGRIVGQLDYFTASERVLTGAVAAEHRPTLYPVVGDTVAHLAVALSALSLVWALIASVRAAWSRRPGAVAPPSGRELAQR